MQLNSENINELSSALAKAQGSMKAALKDSINPHFKSKFSSLNSIWDCCREELSKNGLAVIQQVSAQGDNMMLVTTLSHSSGQWMRSYLPLSTAKSTPQALGSALSYMRRYGLAAMIGVVSDEDDDGNAACATAQEVPQAKKDLLSQQSIDDLVAKLHPDDKAAAIAFCKKNFGSEDLRYLSKASYDSMMKRAIEKLEAEAEDEG